ncbi:hypothetical protein [Bacillus methanolicus]|uniref:hypothetical protein n=1 Tax=Bacillus methanolicus TaxID=1471 RepID=UPI00237FEE15|nr:hypothetical protein [Bacillus methanolicus]
MRLKDILTPEEDSRVQELKMELLEAHNKKEAALIKAEIDEIFKTAKERYYSIMNGKKEQASAVERIKTIPIPGLG